MMKKAIVVVLVAFSFAFTQAKGQNNTSTEEFSFAFVAGKEMFFTPYKGNEVVLEQLYAIIDKYHAEIKKGTIPIHVNGYCASMATDEENRAVAFARSHRVKSELIVHKGLLEAHFITRNHVSAYHGQKDVVEVTLRVPAREEAKIDPPKEPVSATPEPEPEPEFTPTPLPTLIPAPAIELIVETPVYSWDEYHVALRVNLLHVALGALNAGVEWRVSKSAGVKVDGGWSDWNWRGGQQVHKTWYVNPEFRWYMGEPKRFYLGVGATYGEYTMKPGTTGYDGSLYAGGGTMGYQFPIGKRLLLDANIGIGYVRFEYDSFTTRGDGVRSGKEQGRVKDVVAPHQAGISLVWMFGK